MFSVTKLQTKYRKEMIDKNDSRRSKATDSLMNFETVKYFNAEEYEMNRYMEGTVAWGVEKLKTEKLS